jgi:hypothetical protein
LLAPQKRAVCATEQRLEPTSGSVAESRRRCAVMWVLPQKNKQKIVASLFTRSESIKFYLWGMLKDYVYTNSPCIEDHLERSSQDMSLILPEKIQHAINNVFVRCDACMHEAGNNFKHLFFLSIEYKPYMNCIY